MSRLIKEDKDWLYLRSYLHGGSDSYSDWELDSIGNEKYSHLIHQSEHYALDEISVEYKINKHNGLIIHERFDT